MSSASSSYVPLLHERPLRNDLAQDLAAEPLGDLSVHWLGQAGFILRDKNGSIVIVDPYLSESLAEKYQGRLFPHVRLTPAPISAHEIPRADVVLATHGHTDHMDPGTLPVLAERHPHAKFVVPHRELELATARGVPASRTLGAREGMSIEPRGGILVHAIPAAHEHLDINRQGSRFLGYVIEIGGHRVYHSGDCVPFAGQVDRLRALAPTIALLPVNGRDEYRRVNGVPGNFTLEEALRLCEKVGIPQLVVHHWGMFDFNTIDPETLRHQHAAYEGQVRWYIPSLTTCIQG